MGQLTDIEADDISHVIAVDQNVMRGALYNGIVGKAKRDTFGWCTHRTELGNFGGCLRHFGQSRGRLATGAQQLLLLTRGQAVFPAPTSSEATRRNARWCEEIDQMDDPDVGHAHHFAGRPS